MCRLFQLASPVVPAPPRKPTPFIWTEGAEQVWSPVRRGIIPNSVLLEMVQKARITRRDLMIMRTLRKHRFMTGNLLNRLFFMGEASRRAAKQRLDTLCDLRLLTSFNWSLPDGRLSNGKVYALDQAGANLLRAMNGEPYTTIVMQNVRTMEYVFRVLAANELFVRFMETTALDDETDIGWKSFRLEPNLTAQDDARVNLSPTALVQATGLVLDEFALEVVRGGPGLDIIAGKVSRYGEYFKRLEPEERPLVLFLCESQQHALQVEKTIRVEAEVIRRAYSTDEALFYGELFEPGAVFDFARDWDIQPLAMRAKDQ